MQSSANPSPPRPSIRASPIRLINAPLTPQPNLPSASTILLHGIEATGKSLTINAVLAAIDTSSAVVRSQECITTRHLLERTIAVVRETLAAHGQLEEANSLDGRCESISAFIVKLQHLLEGKEKFIVVFDGIDRQPEAAPTLLPAITRLGEIVCTDCSNTPTSSLLTKPSYPTSLPSSSQQPHSRASSITPAFPTSTSHPTRVPKRFLYYRAPRSRSLPARHHLNRRILQ